MKTGIVKKALPPAMTRHSRAHKILKLGELPRRFRVEQQPVTNDAPGQLAAPKKGRFAPALVLEDTYSPWHKAHSSEPPEPSIERVFELALGFCVARQAQAQVFNGHGDDEEVIAMPYSRSPYGQCEINDDKLWAPAQRGWYRLKLQRVSLPWG